jgi:hypothetical protein
LARSTTRAAWRISRIAAFCAGPFGQDAGGTYRSAPPG